MERSGPVALITGASSAIGRAIAVTLAQNGYELALLSRGEAALKATAHACEPSAPLVLPCDITDRTALEQAVQTTVEHYGRLNVLVNVAGVFDWASAIEADLDKWNNLIEVNLKAAMTATRLALPHIKAGGPGAVIFIASMAAKITAPMNAAYIASKHGLLSFAGSVFEDVRDFDIKVCSICPGLVNAGASLGLEKEPGSLIQSKDVAASVQFALDLPGNVCPTEIVLQPQRNPWK